MSTTVFLKRALVIVLAAAGFFDALAVASRTRNIYGYQDDQYPELLVRVYVYDTNAVYRGILFDGAGLDGNKEEMDFAKKFGFCFGGMNRDNGGDFNFTTKYSPGVIRAFNAFAALDNNKHPEFKYMPIITFGCSRGGAAAYSLAMYAADRTICTTPNVGAAYNPTQPTANQMKVPAIFTVGEVDPLVGGQTAVLQTLMSYGRERGALWSHAIIWGMGHEKRRTMHMFASFYEKMIRYSYPDTADPSKGPVTLRRPPESSGWLADQSTWESGCTNIKSWDQYTGNKQAAQWLFDEEMAWQYRGYSSTDIRLNLRTADTAAWVDATHWWWYNQYAPGENVELFVDASKLPGWTKIELYRGTELVDSLKPGAPMKFTVPSADSPIIQAYMLLGYDGSARVYPSILYSVMVLEEPAVYTVRPAYGADPSRCSAVSVYSGKPVFDLAGRLLFQPGSYGKDGVIRGGRRIVPAHTSGTASAMGVYAVE